MNRDTVRNVENYQHRFAFFWYSDREIFESTQEDLDRKVLCYAQQGITHLITFSCTHFRWSFKPYWLQITACLAGIVQAAHKYGLKVIEHHSCCLTFTPENSTYAKHLDYCKAALKSFSGSLDSWEGFVDYNLDETREETAWEQIDAVTGEKISTWYHGHIMCPNNPHYVKAYLAYLETLYAVGIDGIMTDDMQFAEQNIYTAEDRINRSRSCACSYCREAFFREYGYELPIGDKWESWFGNPSDRIYLDFLDFRRKSCVGFHQQVKDHYDSLGLTMIRPNYNSMPIQTNPRGTMPVLFPQLDYFFLECQCSSIIQYSYPEYLLSQEMIRMYTKSRNIPHMMMFYADRPDSLLFAFGVSRLQSAMMTNTVNGCAASVDESLIRAFEKEYAGELFDTSDMATVGIADSQENRFNSAGYGENRFEFFMQSCHFRNIPVKMCRIEEEDTWDVPVLVLNEIHILTDEQIRKLHAYAENGGTLVLSGMCAIQSGAACFRTAEEVNALWGVPLDDESIADRYKVYPCGRGRICVVGYNFGYPGTKEENYKRFVKDERRFRKNYVSPRKHCSNFICSRTSEGIVVGENANLYKNNAPFYDRIARLLTDLAGGQKTFSAEGLPELVYAVPYSVPEQQRFVIQLLNGVGTLVKNAGQKISHKDRIEPPALEGQALFTLKVPENIVLHEVQFVSPGDVKTSLAWERISGGRILIRLDLKLLKIYGMIRIF